MKKLFFITLLAAPLTLWAQPSSQVAWTPEALNLLRSADPIKGEGLAANCQQCHGSRGISEMPQTPSLAGQLPTYLYKQIRDYANGDRVNPMMNALTKSLSEADTAAIAVWFTQQSAAKSEKVGNTPLSAAKKLVEEGDTQRALPPCEICHGSSGKGEKISIPALAGQRADYLITTLKAFKNKTRTNDVYSRMRSIAELLDDDEIVALGQYYQQMN